MTLILSVQGVQTRGNELIGYNESYGGFTLKPLSTEDLCTLTKYVPPRYSFG